MDHACIVEHNDKEWLNFLCKQKARTYLLPENVKQSSSENLSKLFCEILINEIRIHEICGNRLTLIDVTFYETAKNCASYKYIFQ